MADRVIKCACLKKCPEEDEWRWAVVLYPYGCKSRGLSANLSFIETVNSQFSSGVTFSLNPPITLQLTSWMSRWSQTPSWCVATALGAIWQVNKASILPPGGELVSVSTTAPKKINHEVWFWAIWPLTPQSCHCDTLSLHQPIPRLDLAPLLTPDWHQG